MRWAGHVARMGDSRGAYRVLVVRPEGKRPLGRHKRRWNDNIKMDAVHPHTRPTQRLSRPPPIQKLGAENRMLQLNVWCSWWRAYVPETCQAKNISIKLPCCIKLAFQIITISLFVRRWQNIYIYIYMCVCVCVCVCTHTLVHSLNCCYTYLSSTLPFRSNVTLRNLLLCRLCFATAIAKVGN